MIITLKSQELREKQNQRTALILTLGITLGVLMAMYLIRISQTEYKPAFDYGQWVSYGIDQSGSGQQNIPIERIETIEEKNQETEEPQKNDPEAVLDEVETSPNTETRLKTKKEDKKEETQKQEKNKDTPKKIESDKAKENTEGQGDDKNKEGIKGKETGINKEGLYTGAGGSGGSSLSLAGWKWEKEPVVEDKSGVEGRIIFAISVDDEGNIFSIKLMPGTTVADQKIIQKYRDAVLIAYLIEDRQGNARPAGASNGTVTFVLKAR